MRAARSMRCCSRCRWRKATSKRLPLFDDPFLLAVPAGDARSDTARVDARDIEQERLILLEEGHCLRDQALAFCAPLREAPAGLGATSLSTVMQMVANGYGVTLLPKIALDVEQRDERVKLLRFRDPEPARTVGLAWRRTSPRKADFAALGQIVREHARHEQARRGDRRGTGRPDGGRSAGARRRAGDGLRPHAVGGPQVPDGRARRAEPDAQRRAGIVSRALRRRGGCAAARDRGVSAGRLARVERRDGTVHLRRVERTGVSGRHEGLAAVARVAAAARCSGRDTRAAARVDRVG